MIAVLEKKSPDYFLFDGKNNCFCVIDLGKKYYLEINKLISHNTYPIKNFKVTSGDNETGKNFTYP